MVKSNNTNGSSKAKKVFRKYIDPEIVAGTSFDGIQPGDIVQVVLYNDSGHIKPVFVIDIDVRNESDLKAIIATSEDGVKTLHEKDVQSMKLYGEQQTGAAKELRKLQADWLKTRKTLESVMKMLAPLLETRARASMRLSAVDGEIKDCIGRMETDIHNGGNKAKKHKKR